MKYMPPKLLETRTSQSCIGEILLNANKVDTTEYPWASRFIGPFPVPTWQRELCWTIEQEISLIESIWLGLDIGTYIVNDWKMKGQIMIPNSDICIDGQQRINSILKYVNDEFKVFGYYFSHLPRPEQKSFEKYLFIKQTTSTFDEKILKAVYNRLNFGGVNHDASQIAV